MGHNPCSRCKRTYRQPIHSPCMVLPEIIPSSAGLKGPSDPSLNPRRHLPTRQDCGRHGTCQQGQAPTPPGNREEPRRGGCPRGWESPLPGPLMTMEGKCCQPLSVPPAAPTPHSSFLMVDDSAGLAEEARGIMWAYLARYLSYTPVSCAAQAQQGGAARELASSREREEER
jgi:hypothetical protein